MPKQKQMTPRRLQSYVAEFGTEIFSTDNKILFCKICNMKISCEKHFSVTQHITAEKHFKAVKRVYDRKIKYTRINKFFFFVNNFLLLVLTKFL